MHMQKKFIKRHSDELFLMDTAVENMYINEYMPMAPGEYVKVYLLAYMYANSNYEADNESIAKQLGMEVEDVLKAWTYWESMGVVIKHYEDDNDRFDYSIEFVNLKEQLYGNKKKSPKNPKKSEKVLVDVNIKELYKKIEKIIGKPLGGRIPVTIMSWMQELGATEEAIVCAYQYCKEYRNKDTASYVGAVLREWLEKGMVTKTQIEEYLQENDSKHFQYKRVMRALGFTRNSTEQEKALMDRWFGEMGYTLERVLEACKKTSGISNPNINYVNKVLENWQNEKGSEAFAPKEKSAGIVGIAVVNMYYDYIRKNAEELAEEHRKEVYSRIPKIKEIEENVRKNSMEISRLMVSNAPNAKERLADFRKRMQNLLEEKAFLLTDNNLPIDYMDIKYKCELCSDTGTNDIGGRCSCFKERQSEAEIWQNSSKKMKTE